MQKKGVAMGAKYALSVANIFYEHMEAIYGEPRPELKVYKRYIDDGLIVWAGSH